MNRWIRRSLVGVLGLVGIGAAGLALGNWLGDRKATRHVEVAVAAVPIPVDADSLRRGHYLYATRGCAECHGSDGAGKAFIDDGGLYAKAPDITRGGVVAAYRDVDWVRTIRHGVKPGGQPVFIMPSEDYSRLTDADLGALVGYVQAL
ncbi:MAG: cytochrome c, partial [Betaproteobacteria bacterium]